MMGFLSYFLRIFQVVLRESALIHLFRPVVLLPVVYHRAVIKALYLTSIFMNDLLNCLKSSKCYLFADDLKLFSKSSNELFHTDKDSVANWVKKTS